MDNVLIPAYKNGEKHQSTFSGKIVKCGKIVKLGLYRRGCGRLMNEVR
ncbi:MAG: hypothetical protein F6K54_38835 [Okeania sp. SIO3B5]|nr:hypothetical protein [Okeania sp. SIO3B5]NEO58491.1 hypothetical protein [Okeania sp. SIO3B5]